METQARDVEREWIAASRGGDAEAFGRLVEAHQREVYGFILRAGGSRDAADDLTQETFLTAWRKLHSLREDGSFRGWLFRIALNKLRSHWRWQKVRRALSLDNSLAESLEAPRAPREDADLERSIRDAMERLAPRQREAIALRVQGLTVLEIAAVLGVAEGTVKAHLFQAKRLLRERLGPSL